MKRIIVIGAIILELMPLLGCSDQKNIDNSFLKENLVIDEISHIEIEIDIYKQVINVLDLDQSFKYKDFKTLDIIDPCAIK